MDGLKGALSSKGVWGGILAAGGAVAGLIFGVTITDVDTQELAEFASGIAAAVGGIIAIIGRIVATKKIG